VVLNSNHDTIEPLPRFLEVLAASEHQQVGIRLVQKVVGLFGLIGLVHLAHVSEVIESFECAREKISGRRWRLIVILLIEPSWSNGCAEIHWVSNLQPRLHIV
jgi:hypothetical protein